MSYVIIPGTPEIPGTPGYYVDYPYSWDSGAVSIPVASGAAGYEFRVPASVVGVVVGLSDRYAGTGYTTIAHALYFASGRVKVLEFGVEVGDLGTYVDGDLFVLWRNLRRAYVIRNGVFEFDRPQRLGAGSFSLCATMYAPDDTVVDAAVTTMVAGIGEASASLQPVYSMSFEEMEDGYADAILMPLEADASADNDAWGDAVIGPLAGLTGDYDYAESRVALAPLTSYSESPSLAPSFGSADAILMPLNAGSYMLSGGLLTCDAAVLPMVGLTGDYDYAESRVGLQPLSAFTAEGVVVNLIDVTIRERYRVTLIGSVGYPPQTIRLPTAQARAWFGSRIDVSAPACAATASMTCEAVMRAYVTGPACKVSASLSVDSVIRADVAIEGRYLVGLQGGSAICVTGPSARATLTGLIGIVGRIDAVFVGRYAAALNGDVRKLVVWDITGPALVAVPSIRAYLIGPRSIVRASMSMDVATSYESYAINLNTGAVSHYTQYPFDNVLRFGGRFFGVKHDGVFELVGETDDGEEIHAVATTFMTNFGDTNLKRVPWVYLVGRLADGAIVTIQPDEGTPYTYNTVGAYDGAVRTHRAKIGNGIRGANFAFTIENAKGGTFDIGSVDAIVSPTLRAM